MYRAVVCIGGDYGLLVVVAAAPRYLIDIHRKSLKVNVYFGRVGLSGNVV